MDLSGKQIKSSEIEDELILLRFTDVGVLRIQLSSRWTDTPAIGDRLVFRMFTTLEKSDHECP
jgi:hypothetical protein